MPRLLKRTYDQAITSTNDLDSQSMDDQIPSSQMPSRGLRIMKKLRAGPSMLHTSLMNASKIQLDLNSSNGKKLELSTTQ